MSVKVKDPQSIEPFGFDYTPWLAELDGDVIVVSTWDVPVGLNEVTTSIIDGVKTSVTLSGGTAKLDYFLTNHITTATGVEDERSLLIKVRNK